MKIPFLQGFELSGDFVLGMMVGYSFRDLIRKFVRKWFDKKHETN